MQKTNKFHNLLLMKDNYHAHPSHCLIILKYLCIVFTIVIWKGLILMRAFKVENVIRFFT